MPSQPSAAEHLGLVSPAPKLALACQAMFAEFLETNAPPFTNVELTFADFPAFTRELDDEARGVGLPAGVVPQQTY